MYLKENLEDLREKGLDRKMTFLESSQAAFVSVKTKKYLNFCSNNYLGLANDPRVVAAAKKSLEDFGLGTGASRLVSGSFSPHEQLEERLAEFKHTQRALVFSTGYMANVGIISSLFSREDIIFSDRLNHASIVDGILLSGAKFKRYPHCDVAALESMIKEQGSSGKKIIITDSVFSMDGDIAPLDKIVEVARRHNCMIMVDEAHALGVLGKRGCGAVEHFGLEGKIDIQMGTLSKAAGSFGAYCCGSEALIHFLINKARSFIYTTALPVCVAAGAMEGLRIIEEDGALRERLWENTKFLKGGLKSLGFEILGTQTPIIPIIIGGAQLAVDFAQRLREKNIFVSAIRPPTVPAKTSRLRITVMATHQKNDLEYLLEHVTKIGRDLCLI